MVCLWAHRPRIDIDGRILEMIVEISATSSDSGLLTHTKRHYDVKYLASVKESVETNQKLSSECLREQYNLIARETEMPTASMSMVKRRCLAPHSGHKNSQHYSNEAKIKLGRYQIQTQGFHPLTYSIVEHLQRWNKESHFVLMNSFPIFASIPQGSSYSWVKKLLRRGANMA